MKNENILFFFHLELVSTRGFVYNCRGRTSGPFSLHLWEIPFHIGEWIRSLCVVFGCRERRQLEILQYTESHTR